MTTIKPIETIYKGYKFRSRLEARWAVFLDQVGVPYCYEHEGFDLNGTWYLPDFWLPDSDSFIEIKPNKDFNKEERIRNWTLCSKLRDKTERHVFLIVGNPFPGEYIVHQFGMAYDDEEPYPLNQSGVDFSQCRRCSRIAILREDICNDWKWINKGTKDCSGCSEREPHPDSDLIRKAFISARQMRF